jgi:hypothetical protein
MMAESRFLIQFRKNSVPLYQIHDVEESQLASTVAEHMSKDKAWFTDTNLIGSTARRLCLGQLYLVVTAVKTDICITKTYEDDATVLKVSDKRNRVPLLPESDDESEAKTSDDEDKTSDKYLEYKVFCIRNVNNIVVWAILKARDLLNYIASSDYVKLNQANTNTIV